LYTTFATVETQSRRQFCNEYPVELQTAVLSLSAGRSHTEEIEHLLEELPAATVLGADALMSLVGERLGTVFGSTFCIAYRQRDLDFDPVFVTGDVAREPLTGDRMDMIARTLSRRLGPVRLDSRGRSELEPALACDVKRALGAWRLLS
jgi:hypothetical protein